MPYFDDLKTYRERAGIRIAALARAAGIDRSTVTRVENHKNSTPETLHMIINALNDLYYRNNGALVAYDVVVTLNSKYGSWS
jgi:transcriptional regulator with XRE-family HTH domain